MRLFSNMWLFLVDLINIAGMILFICFLWEIWKIVQRAPKKVNASSVIYTCCAIFGMLFAVWMGLLGMLTMDIEMFITVIAMLIISMYGAHKSSELTDEYKKNPKMDEMPFFVALKINEKEWNVNGVPVKGGENVEKDAKDVTDSKESKDDSKKEIESKSESKPESEPVTSSKDKSDTSDDSDSTSDSNESDKSNKD